LPPSHTTVVCLFPPNLPWTRHIDWVWCQLNWNRMHSGFLEPHRHKFFSNLRTWHDVVFHICIRDGIYMAAFTWTSRESMLR
jgi:hypothetical protein